MKINKKIMNGEHNETLSNSGEMERKERIDIIINLDTRIITLNESINQKEAEAFIRTLKAIKNKVDGRIAEIPVNTIGKIIKHKGYDTSKIIKYLSYLYETSIFGWSENEIRKEGHKEHLNFKAHHHYINKFSDGNSEYFIRFTLNEERTKPGKIGKNYIHSTAISDIAKYKKTMDPLVSVNISTGVKNSSSFYDYRLAYFFASVNNVKK